MKKLYIDLAIVIICIFLIIKNITLLMIIAGILAVLWFFVLDDKKKTEIKNKISEFYR